MIELPINKASLTLGFLGHLSMWRAHDKSRDKVTPRYFTLEDSGMGTSPTVK